MYIQSIDGKLFVTILKVKFNILGETFIFRSFTKFFN